MLISGNKVGFVVQVEECHDTDVRTCHSIDLTMSISLENKQQFIKDTTTQIIQYIKENPELITNNDFRVRIVFMNLNGIGLNLKLTDKNWNEDMYKLLEYGLCHCISRCLINYYMGLGFDFIEQVELCAGQVANTSKLLRDACNRY